MEKGKIIRKALTAEGAKKLDEVLKNAPKAAAFNHAELKQTKEADGSTSFSLSFRQTLKDALLLAIKMLQTSGKVTQEEADQLSEYHTFIKNTVEELQIQDHESGRKDLRIYAKDELLKGEGAKDYARKLDEVLKTEHVNGLLKSLLFPPKKEKKQPTKYTEGIGGAKSIIMSKAYVEQTVSPNARKKEAQQRLPFEAAKDYAKKTGIQLKPDEDSAAGQLKNYGVKLTTAQDRAVKTLLSVFTHTNYRGNTQAQPVKDLLPKFTDSYEEPAEELPAWKHVGGTVPCIRITQAEYLRLYGIERSDSTASVQSEMQEAIKALKHISTQQYVFYWQRQKTERKAQTGKGKRKRYTYDIVKNADGTVKLEDIRAVGTLFYLKEVKDELQPDLLAYYEISPSVVMLDRLREGYGPQNFLTYPLELERQVVKKTGKQLKKIEGKLLLWLAYQFEEGRRHRLTLQNWGNEAALSKLHGRLLPEVEVIDWKDLANELDEPESQIKKKPKQVHKRLQAAYEIAVKAGFLTKYERGGEGTDRLYYNAAAFQQTTETEAK